MAVGHDIIVIGASAGGMQVLMEILRGLPRDLPACVFAVIHTAPTSPGILPQILDRVSDLGVTHALNGEVAEHGRVYVAPPDHHMMLQDGRVMLTRGPRENGFRPAVDPLFRTAARVYGPRVIGVVLSGGLDDGTEGLTLIKRHGGVAVVQDPDEAIFPSMPANAAGAVEVDHVLKAAAIAPVLVKLAHQPVPEGALSMADGNGAARDVAAGGDNALKTGMPGAPSNFTCPECGGALWELRDGKLIKFRCHVGHGYTPEGLVAAQSEALETALRSALRALEENADLRRRMARRASRGSWPLLVRQYEQQAEETEQRATVIRDLLLSGKGADGHHDPGALAEQRDNAVQATAGRRGNGRGGDGRGANWKRPAKGDGARAKKDEAPNGRGGNGRGASGKKATPAGRAADGKRASDGNRAADGKQAADGKRAPDGKRAAAGNKAAPPRAARRGERDNSTVPVKGAGK